MSRRRAGLHVGRLCCGRSPRRAAPHIEHEHEHEHEYEYEYEYKHADKQEYKHADKQEFRHGDEYCDKHKHGDFRGVRA